jgi:hypothetical protein
MRLTSPALALALGPACIIADGDTGTIDAAAQQQADIDAYEALQDELMANATVVVPLGGSVVEMQTSPSRLWYARFVDWDPDLYNLDAATSQITGCGRIAGSGDAPNFRASDQMSAVAVGTQGDIELYSADACDLLATVDLPPPTSGLRWWAYAVDGDALYAVVETADAHTVWRWRGGALTELGTLEGAGYAVGEFWDFGVEGDTLLYLESGRLYVLDLDAWAATWVEHDQQVTGSVSWDSTHVLFVAANGAVVWDRVTAAKLDLGATVNALPDRNNTYTDLEDYNGGDATLDDGVVYYESGRGLMAYDLDAGVITPLVLEERDLSLVWYQPVVAGGVVFARSYGDFDSDIWRLTP